ncbi:MAG: NAD+ synthase [Alphaproteobacteria bacterium]|nr:NAD+ synthase [Alphaproteobacteria bacterium]MDA7982907.1 NAD+ synthase [Alphaproteobacteria bacterium]MDA7988547.1 NAD+ synthase [Alphaproteobacteria bacterium]MDA8008949.1 NAD+ synthase [Alphaproteobacteria bacterium]
MSNPLKLGMAQINPKVGDFAANEQTLMQARAAAQNLGAELVLAGELALVGYPPEDLLARNAFIAAAETTARKIAAQCDSDGPALLFGAPIREGEHLYNALLLADNGELKTAHKKCVLPNYGVFDEKRYFTPADPAEIAPLKWRDRNLGVLLCEDCWEKTPAQNLAARNAQCLLVANASPYSENKHLRRRELMSARAKENKLGGVYVNLVGAQEDLVFDGSSFAVDDIGAELARLASFTEETALVTLAARAGRLVPLPADSAPAPSEDAARYAAVTLGVRDYFAKSGFTRALLGLSGGIDSAVVLALAVDALGAGNVRAFMLPSEYTSAESREDAAAVAAALNVSLHEMEIGAVRDAAEKTLAPVFGDDFNRAAPGLAEENLQSRIRGALLMTLANQSGDLLLATGNKSEFAVGYATLYGDTCGGYAPLKDIYKTQVYQLARWRNEERNYDARGADGEIFPPRILSKPPSAELRPDQTDQDTLPPYEILDAVLHGLLERNRAPAELIDDYDPGVVFFVVERLRESEFKRRQAPPGPRVSVRAFGRDRRHPILDNFIEERL